MARASKGDVDYDAKLVPVYGSRDVTQGIPKYALPEEGMEARSAYRLVMDEVLKEGNPRLNLATFVTTWMEPEAKTLMAETFDKNMIDKDEYPQTAEIERRCVIMLGRLWRAPDISRIIGCSTTGSSEACMLAGLALKWKWRERRRQAGKSTDRPNLVMGINVQVCWEKFCRYWDVEMRLAPMEPGSYALTPEKMLPFCDENTIGVVAILGSTFTGEYEPVSALHDALMELNGRTGWDVPLHVDAASGGMVAPFLEPDVAWDFRLPLVKSINTSGHKYGLVYPGVGWAVWRDQEELHEDLVFKVNYLGGEMPTFALNFSRPGNQVLAQYYNFIRLGYEGYRRVQQACRDVAQYIAGELAGMNVFDVIHDGSDLPVLAWRIKDGVDVKFTLFELSDRLRMTGWQVPAYSFPDNLTDVVVMRVVVREGVSRDVADMLLEDIHQALRFFESSGQSGQLHASAGGEVAFHH